jgi:hypothetical protein
MSSKLDEMVQGYMDGLDWPSDKFYYPASLVSQSPAYRHGFMNGVDDRDVKPRERADVLRRRARMILGDEK